MKPARMPGGTPAPYGRACMNCSHAKCKCMLLPTGSGCERCQRLGKECRPAQTVRRRNHRSTACKFANLEAKMDYVLAAYPELQGSTNSGLPPDWETADLVQSQPDALHQSRPGTIQTPTSLSSSSTRNGVAYPASEDPAYHDILTFLYVPPAMAQKYLDQFRTHNLQYLPFVYIPPDTTSDSLQANYPFFWICIMEVLTTRNPEKGDSFRKITKHIHQRIMVDVSPSMDLLLGIMTFISWVTYTKRPFLNSYSHILMGVVAELGINQGVSRDKSIMHDYKVAIGIKKSQPPGRTLEERRAVLGCYLISSCTALSMSKIDPMRWTPHMQESLSVLAEAKECLEDEILIALVKIHLVLDRSYQLRRDGEVINSLSFYLSSFKAQLDAVKQEIPPHLRQHRVILLYVYNAEVTINDMSLASPAIPHLPDIERLGSLYTSLQATKSWLDIWLEIEPEEYLQLSSIVFFQFVRVIVNLYKLSILEDPAWSKSEVRQTANVLEYLDRNIALLKSCPQYLTFEEGRELTMLEKGLKMTTSLKHSWEPKLTELWGLNVNDGSMLESDDMLPPVMPLTEIEEAWMMEFLGSM